jgi:hypothetical protein
VNITNLKISSFIKLLAVFIKIEETLQLPLVDAKKAVDPWLLQIGLAYHRVL